MIEFIIPVLVGFGLYFLISAAIAAMRLERMQLISIECQRAGEKLTFTRYGKTVTAYGRISTYRWEKNGKEVPHSVLLWIWKEVDLMEWKK